MSVSRLLRWPFACVGELLTAVAKPSEAEARMLSRMYPDMDALNEIEAELEVHESGPYLKWGGDDSLRSSCLGCGYPHSTETQCLRDGSISFKSYDSMSSPGVPPPGASPGGEVESRPETTAPSSPGVDPSGANGSIPPGAVPGEGPVADSDIPPSPATGQPMTEVAFASRLGFGDNISEPAATLADMVEPIEQAFYDARDHQECPRTCERCGERLAATVCPDCNGSGCGPGTASGAYDECELCAGGGWLHDGCADKSYADLVTELQHVREGAQTLGRIIHRMQRVVLDITGLHSLIDETGDGPWDVVWEALAEGYGKPTARLSASYTPPK